MLLRPGQFTLEELQAIHAGTAEEEVRAGDLLD